MRVTPAALPPVARDHGKPAAAEQPRFKLNSSPAEAGTTPEKAAAPAAVAGRQLPPGLDRVMARLEALPPESRSAGQSNALERIGRNIARYQEHHGIATPPASVPEAPAPVAETPATPVVVPVETTSATPAEPVAETPATAPVAVPVAPVATAPVAEPVVEPVVGEPAPIVADTPAAAPVVDPLAVLPEAPAAGEVPPPGATIDVQA